MNALLTLTVANIKSLLRDRAALFWSVFFPVMFVFLFGWIFGGTSDINVKIGVVNEDSNAVFSGQVSDALGKTGIVTVVTGSLDDEKAALQRGDISAVVVIPAGAGQSILAKQPVTLGLYEDPSQTQTNQIVNQVLSQIVSGANLGLAGGTPLVQLPAAPSTLNSNNIGMVAYLVPSILAMALMQLGVFAAIPLVQQREKGILKRLGATPLQRWKLIGSNVLMRLIVAIVNAVIILGIGLAVFDVKIVGSILGVAGLVLLGAGTFLALGFFLAAFLKTEEQATGVVQVVQIPMMFLSGIFFPFTMLPGFLQTIARILPLTYLGDALRQVMVNGSAVAPLGVDLAILVGWLVVCLAIATRSFRWE